MKIYSTLHRKFTTHSTSLLEEEIAIETAMVTVDMAVESVDMEVASEATVVVVEIVEAAEVYKNKVV